MTHWFLNGLVLRRRRIPRGVPRDLSPEMMRDIGLDPWPERPRIPFYPLW
mgnify:CR=1 FL=1